MPDDTHSDTTDDTNETPLTPATAKQIRRLLDQHAHHLRSARRCAERLAELSDTLHLDAQLWSLARYELDAAHDAYRYPVSRLLADER